VLGNSLGAAVALAARSPRIAARASALPARWCRTPLAPPPLPPEIPARSADRPCVVGVGEHDRFLPPRRLVPVVRRTMDLDVRVLRAPAT
jgi:hypothetical protein